MARGGRESTSGPPFSLRGMMRAFLLWMFALALAHALWPSAGGVIWTLLPVTAAVAIVAGTVVNKSETSNAWFLLAAAFGAWACVDGYVAATGRASSSATSPLGAQLLSATAYVFTVLGLLVMVRSHAVDDRGGLLDGLMMACALTLLGWAFLVVPAVSDGDHAWGGRFVAVVYPLSGMVRVPLLAKLFTGGGARLPAVWLLAGGAAAGFVSDVAYAQLVLSGRHPSLRFGLDVGWAVFYTAWGAAALHPSMAAVSRPAPHHAARTPWLRLVVFGGICLIAPVVFVAWALAHGEGELAVLGAFAGVAIVLVLGRLALLFADYRRAGARGRVVGAAGAAMVAAFSVEDVAAALSRAGEGLFGAPGRDRVQLVRQGWDATIGPGPVPATGLPEPIAQIVGGYAAALVIPVASRTVRAGQHPSVLVAAGTPHELIALQGSVEALAAQAALAIDRVELGDEVRRRASEAYFRTLIQNAADGIMIVGDGGRITFASPSARKLFAPARLEGESLRALVGDEAADEIRTSLGGEHVGPVDWTLKVPGGERFDVEVTADDLRGDETVGAVVLTLRDVTDRRALEAQLTSQAFGDPLTGLPNRRRFQQRLETAFAAASPDDPYYLLLLDLDDFKEVNDTRGHSIGDELLVAAGKRLSSAVRPGDVAARIGGDEFAVLLEHVHGSEAAEALAERIVRAFGDPFVLDGDPTSIGVSVGFASSAQCSTAEEVLRNADLALYSAKNEGKHRWRHYESGLHAEIVERAGMRASLDQAIADRSILMDYQPVVDLADGRVVGFEALVRWPHPDHGLLLPDRFIPLAEETGQIVPLGRWIMRQAVQDAALWTTHAAGMWVAVNVSGRQFADPAFVDGVLEVLDASGMPPGQVVLELTESSLLQLGSGRVVEALGALKSLGVRVALDDFGTGFSSLSYLTELPVDILKIDKSFVAGATGSPDRVALVEGIIRIADALHIDVIAEGIETTEQWDRLAATHCQYGQGFLFSRPMPATGVHALLRSEPVPHLPAEA